MNVNLLDADTIDTMPGAISIKAGAISLITGKTFFKPSRMGRWAFVFALLAPASDWSESTGQGQQTGFADLPIAKNPNQNLQIRWHWH